MFHFESLLGPQYWSGSHDINVQESTLSYDAYIVISQNVLLQFLKGRFINIYPFYFYVKL